MNGRSNKNTEKQNKVNYIKHKGDFTPNKRNQLIKEWERETQQIWPTYKETVFREDGGVFKKVGDCYDAHHINPQILGGKHDWWNIHPMPFDGHLEIHAPGSALNKIIQESGY